MTKLVEYDRHKCRGYALDKYGLKRLENTGILTRYNDLEACLKSLRAKDTLVIMADQKLSRSQKYLLKKKKILIQKVK